MYSVGWQLFHFNTESNISTCYSTHGRKYCTETSVAADKPKNVGDLF